MTSNFRIRFFDFGLQFSLDMLEPQHYYSHQLKPTLKVGFMKLLKVEFFFVPGQRDWRGERRDKRQ